MIQTIKGWRAIVTLKKQIEVLEKLLKDGAISEEEFLKSNPF